MAPLRGCLTDARFVEAIVADLRRRSPRHVMSARQAIWVVPLVFWDTHWVRTSQIRTRNRRPDYTIHSVPTSRWCVVPLGPELEKRPPPTPGLALAPWRSEERRALPLPFSLLLLRVHKYFYLIDILMRIATGHIISYLSISISSNIDFNKSKKKPMQLFKQTQ